MLGLAGIMRIFDAIWAFRYDGAIPDGFEGAILGNESDDLRLGLVTRRGDLVLVIVRRDEPLATRALDRILAGGVLSISAIWRMPYNPVWSLVYVLIGVLVVYALAAHGGRYKVDM